MTLVTIDGHIGAGAGDLGRRVAKMLGHSYVDRLVLPGYANETIASQDQIERPRLSERIWNLVEKAVRGVALGNAAGDPYFASAELMMYPLTWDSSPGAPMSEDQANEPDHPHSLSTLVKNGRSVLVQRAGAVALKGQEQVLKIGVFASWEDRVSRMMKLQGLNRSSEAERIIRERERAQQEYFSSFHSAHPEDENLYDLCVNTSREQISLAAVKVSRAAQAPVPAFA